MRTEVLIEKIGFLKDVLLEIYRFLKIDGLLEIDRFLFNIDRYLV